MILTGRLAQRRSNLEGWVRLCDNSANDPSQRLLPRRFKRRGFSLLRAYSRDEPSRSVRRPLPTLFDRVKPAEHSRKSFEISARCKPCDPLGRAAGELRVLG